MRAVKKNVVLSLYPAKTNPAREGNVAVFTDVNGGGGLFRSGDPLSLPVSSLILTAVVPNRTKRIHCSI